jgi:hypothetical protein
MAGKVERRETSETRTLQRKEGGRSAMSQHRDALTRTENGQGGT